MAALAEEVVTAAEAAVEAAAAAHEQDEEQCLSASTPFSIPTKGKCPTCGLLYDETPSVCPACKNSYMGLRDREDLPGYDVARAAGASVWPELPELTLLKRKRAARPSAGESTVPHSDLVGYYDEDEPLQHSTEDMLLLT